MFPSLSKKWLVMIAIFPALGILLGACMSFMPQKTPRQTVSMGELLLEDEFTHQQGWDAREGDWAFMNIVNEGYRMWLTRNVYLYGLYYEDFTDTVMEADALLLSENPRTLYGLRCRTSVGNTANGYYFMLSADGAYSIRYGAGNAIDPIIQWQNHSAIHTDGRINTIRVICSNDYLALYVNDQFVADATDTRYSSGFPGFALALPDPTTIDNPADVVFDNVRIWSARNN